MAATNSKAYLITAHYNHANWKALVKDEEVEAARQAAEELFPIEEVPLPQVDPTASQKAHLKGVRIANTFRSGIFDELPGGFETLPRKEQDDKLDQILGPQIRRTEIGWMVVVGVDLLEPFITKMSAAAGVFWRMFEVELFTLDEEWTLEDIENKVPSSTRNNDNVWEDIYSKMEPVHWGKRLEEVVDT